MYDFSCALAFIERPKIQNLSEARHLSASDDHWKEFTFQAICLAGREGRKAPIVEESCKAPFLQTAAVLP